MLTRSFKAVKRLLTGKNVSDSAELVGDALYTHGSKPDIEAISAVAGLTTALCNNQCSAAVDAGLFVFFKIQLESGDFQIFYKRLTRRERTLLNRQPSLLKEPTNLLESLDDPVALEHDKASEFRRISMDEADKTPRT